MTALVLAATLTAAGRLVADAPVTPDPETARRWAESELRDPIYHPSFNLLGWLQEKISELLDGLGRASQELTVIQVVAVAVVIVVVVLALYVAGPVRRSRSGPRSHVVLGAEERSAQDLRDAAGRSAAQGRYDDAVIDGYRAIVRSLEERAVLDSRPGRTAHEASTEAARRFPALSERLHRVGRLFDDICYGHTGAVAIDHDVVRTLDRDLLAARPEDPAGVAELVAPR